MHEVTIKKIKGGTAIRTDVTVGRCHNLPVVGESFEMFSEPLNKNASVRWITTSTVQNVVEETDYILIETKNSTYRLEVKEIK
jgi:hypothetical protein